MDKSKAFGTGRLTALYSVLYLIIFLVFYIPNYIFPDYFLELPDGALNVFLIFRDALERLVQFFVPLSAATYLLLRSAKRGIRSIFLPSLLSALPSLVYAVPYCYLYALSQGFDSVEGLMISALLSVVGVVLLALEIVALMFVCRAVLGFAIGRGLTGSVAERRLAVQEKLDGALLAEGVFNLSSPLSRGIFASGLAIFAVQTVGEIISVVTSLSQDGAYYEVWDVVYVACTFLFMLVELLGCHAACYYIAKSIKNKENDD